MNALANRFTAILYALPAIIVAFTLHELSHALAADKLGDPTPRSMGRISLNPMRHVDWMGLVFFALLGFGWAKPVQVNISNFKNRKVGDILTSIAGPLMNLLLAILFLGLYMASSMVFNIQSALYYNILTPFVTYNFILFLFNLLPVPPLDGYRVVKSILYNSRTYRAFQVLDRYGMFFLLAFILLLNYTGILAQLQWGFIELFGGLFRVLFGG